MSFRFSGALSGRFPDGAGNVTTYKEWLCTLVGLYADQHQPTGSYIMSLRVNASAAGSYALGLDGRTGRGTVILRFTPAGEGYTRDYVSTSGSVQFTELTNERARGRFTATLVEADEGGQIQITDGWFNMELDGHCDED